jgi:hypothetical protein
MGNKDSRVLGDVQDARSGTLVAVGTSRCEQSDRHPASARSVPTRDQGGHVAKSSQGVAFGSPDRGKATAREPAGRRCKEPGCGTTLSTYNRSATCFTHTPGDTRHATHR